MVDTDGYGSECDVDAVEVTPAQLGMRRAGDPGDLVDQRRHGVQRVEADRGMPGVAGAARHPHLDLCPPPLARAQLGVVGLARDEGVGAQRGDGLGQRAAFHFLFAHAGDDGHRRRAAAWRRRRHAPDRCRDRGLLVADPEPVEAPVADLAAERVDAPAFRGVERDGVDVPVDHEGGPPPGPMTPIALPLASTSTVVETGRLHGGGSERHRRALGPRDARGAGQRHRRFDQGGIVDREHLGHDDLSFSGVFARVPPGVRNLPDGSAAWPPAS